MYNLNLTTQLNSAFIFLFSHFVKWYNHFPTYSVYSSMSECVLLRTTTTLPVLNLIKCGIIYKLSTFIILHDLDVIGASDSFKVKKAIKYFYGKMWNEKEESSFNETRRYLFSCLLMVFDNIGHLQKVDLV